MIVDFVFKEVNGYLKNNIQGYLYYSIKHNEFKCYNKQQCKSWLIYITLFDKKTTDYELEIICEHTKKILNLYELGEIPENIKKKECNGCGNKKFGWLIPELTFHNCCNIHDYMYYKGGTKYNKYISDKVFIYNMILSSPKWYYKLSAYIYYYFVICLGAGSFNYTTGSSTGTSSK